MKKKFLFQCFFITSYISVLAQPTNTSHQITQKQFDPSTLLWYEAPAKKWNEALPVGNGRLGAMVFGAHKEERIQLNEETYWSGGPYSTVVKGGAEALPQIQKYIFEGEAIKAHKLFGRKLMGYPVEQQKYQSLANLILFFENQDSVKGYKRWLDLKTGITSTEYTVNGITYHREVFASAPDQVIAVRLTASKANSLTFRAQLRGERNSAHSNYATDYFTMDGVGQDGMMVNGKSADYLGVEGKIRYKAQLKAEHEGGTIKFDDDYLIIEKANSVTFYIAAATNFINYKDVSADHHKRAADYLDNVKSKTYEAIKSDAISDFKKYFDRVTLTLPTTENSFLPTDKRKANAIKNADPNLASLAYNFGRYILIGSSRPGTQPANLQGIWNGDMNPMWDSKYTTNINTQMNYWPAETGNLPEMVEPLITMVKELMDQGSQVAKEHYGARGWVFHQNTDIWRVAAPMDGPTWGTFTVGGAWLTNHLYDHYLFNQDKDYLKEIYPVMKGAVQFFMDFLVETPDGKWLVTNPSTSPENPPKGPGYEYFFDEVTAMYYFTSICYGAAIDMQILHELFGYYLETEKILGLDPEFSEKVQIARSRLVPSQIGKDGTLQEWAEDYDQLEPNHRHNSHMYGLYPGNVISVNKTPELIDACKAVLNKRGDGSAGWSRAWKVALWARMYDGNRANSIFKGYMAEQSFAQLFADCAKAMQVDGTLGMAAGITEMLIHSHEGIIELLPALPDEWASGRFDGVCARGGFVLDLTWTNKKISSLDLHSKSGNDCKIKVSGRYKVTKDGKNIPTKLNADGSMDFKTVKGGLYRLTQG